MKKRQNLEFNRDNSSDLTLKFLERGLLGGGNCQSKIYD